MASKLQAFLYFYWLLFVLVDPVIFGVHLAVLKGSTRLETTTMRPMCRVGEIIWFLGKVQMEKPI
jgi:hypothetical protein